MGSFNIAFWLAWALGWLAWCSAARRVRGMTLVGPWWWAAGFWAVTGICQWLVQQGATLDGEPSWAEATRFAAAMGAFCPVMSVLGAKRPQDQGWHFVVLSLWGMLALPAAEVLLLHPGQQLDIHDARTWFLLALVFVNLIHFLPTRFWCAGLLVSIGQIVLLAPYLPGAASLTSLEAMEWLLRGDARQAIATLCFTAAMIAGWLARRPRLPLPFSQAWREFRDLYGVLWSLRVAQRVNDAAASNDWPIQLRWSGLYRLDSTADGANELGEEASEDPLATHPADVIASPYEGDLDPAWSAGLENCLRGLLRRFVSSEWMDRRLGAQMRSEIGESTTPPDASAQ